MKNLLLTVLVALMVLFVSCNKQEEEPTTTMPTSTEDLKVPQDFKWKTTKDIQLTLKGAADDMVEILSPKGVTYWKVFVKANETATSYFSIPSYETALQLKYQGQTVDLKVNSEKLSYEFQ